MSFFINTLGGQRFASEKSRHNGGRDKVHPFADSPGREPRDALRLILVPVSQDVEQKPSRGRIRRGTWRRRPWNRRWARCLNRSPRFYSGCRFWAEPWPHFRAFNRRFRTDIHSSCVFCLLFVVYQLAKALTRNPTQSSGAASAWTGRTRWIQASWQPIQNAPSHFGNRRTVRHQSFPSLDTLSTN